MSELKLFTDPRIELVGRPSMNIEGVLSFLDEHNLDWPEFRAKLNDNRNMIEKLEGKDAEWLIEEAGRGCYMSFKGKGRDHEAHVKHLIEVQHGCYDSETEVLTKEGWKKFEDIKIENDLFATRTESGILEYHKAKGFNTYYHKGRMYRVESRGVDLLVTPNHNMLVCRTTTQEGRKRQKFELFKAENLGHVSHAYVKNAEWDVITHNDLSDLYKLLGFAIGDASLRGLQLTFHLYKERKIMFLFDICEKLQLKITEKSDNNFVVQLEANQKAFFDIYNESSEKRIPQWLLFAPKKELISLYLGLIESDGHYGSTGNSFDTTSRELANQFQQLCLHIGLAANIYYEYDNTKRQSSFGNKTLIRLSVIRRELTPEINKYVGMVGKSCWIDDWEGDVYCVEVPNNTLYVRRNGKPVWCGNSVLEHVNFNFHVWGISRSCSHEIVRHRAGFAYCLAGDTEIYSGSKCNDRFNGVRKKWTIEQLHKWSIDPKRKGRLKLILLRCFDGKEFVRTKIKSVQKSGIKKIFKVILEDGKTIKCSSNHRFLSEDGWLPLRDLKTDMKIAVNGIECYKDCSWLKQKYHNENLSQQEMAQLAGVSKHTIRSWIKRFKLQKIPGSWSIGKEPWNKNKTYTTGYHHSDATIVLLSESKMGTKNPAWRGKEATKNAARQRARKLFRTEECANCQSVLQIHRHHIDRNPHNNHISNIMFLCNSCHQKLHHEEDGPKVFTAVWKKIIKIIPMSSEMTYDLEVEHPSHNFVANGIITHNSQLSQRYVNSSDCAFVVPPAMLELKETKPDIYNMWLRSCERSQQLYEILTSELAEMYKDTESKTELRKKARQAARSVLPNATETKMLITCNGRAARHFCEMRGSPAADVEIRKLAIQMFNLLSKDFPLITHGMEVIALEDGTEGIESKFRKV